MKKNLLLVAAIISTLALTGCKSKESDYKKAYEKAQAEEAALAASSQQTISEAITTTPVITPVSTDTSSDRSEKLTAIGGGVLKAYNVVCGAFSKIENANNVRNELVNKGYNAIVAQNPDTKLYRVVAASYDDRNSAVSVRDGLRATYPDAWLLKVAY